MDRRIFCEFEKEYRTPTISTPGLENGTVNNKVGEIAQRAREVVEIADLNVIYKHFQTTEHGKKLHQQSRWARYKTADMDSQQWEKLLGADVNNLKHMLLTYKLAKKFLKSVSEHDHGPAFTLSKDEEQLILKAALIHDGAEAVGGDIMFDLKTNVDEKKEVTVLRHILNTELISFFTGMEIEKALESIFKRETKLGNVFNLIERLGYCRTALIAWERSKQENLSPDLRLNLTWLCGNALGNQISPLLKAAEIKPVNDFLDGSKEKISEAFDQIPHSIFDKYPDEEKPVQVRKYMGAKQDWEERKIAR